MNLSDLGEFGFLERMRSWLPAGEANVGIGDDAAVLQFDRAGGPTLVATADSLVEGVHFRLDWSTASDVGFKAVSVNVSDLAAMGARPRWLLLALCAPGSTSEDVLAGIYGGIVEACSLYDAELVGGDTVSSEQLVLSVTALGELEGDPLLRSGARAGDALAVTGPLGRAAAGVNLLLSQDSSGVTPEDGVACLDAHRRPVARPREGALLAGVAHAAMDLTDGLASDVHRMAEASGVGIEIDLDSLPIAPEARRIARSRGWDGAQMVLGGGEDLELLVAVAPDALPVPGVELIQIGRVVDEGVWLVGPDGRTPLQPSGYDHFRRS